MKKIIPTFKDLFEGCEYGTDEFLKRAVEIGKFFNNITPYHSHDRKSYGYVPSDPTFNLEKLDYFSKKIKIKSILEIGSGIGLNLYLFKQFFGRKRIQYIGVENSEALVKLSTYLLNIPIWNNYTNTKVKIENAFTCSELIIKADFIHCYHILEDRQMMQALFSVIKDNMKEGAIYFDPMPAYFPRMGQDGHPYFQKGEGFKTIPKDYKYDSFSNLISKSEYEKV